MNIVITGASRGMGFEVTLQLLQHPDARIIAIASSSQSLKSLINKAKKLPGELIPLPFDLMQPDEIPTLVKSIAQHFKKVDFLLNNAGMVISNDFDKIKWEESVALFYLNFFSPAQLIKNLIPLLNKSASAHVVNISSIGGIQGSTKFAGLSYYSSSKAALANLTECLAEEYKNTKIKFNSLAPGAVQTDMLSLAFPGYKAPVNPQQIAPFIADFLINGHRFFNGKILPVSSSTP